MPISTVDPKPALVLIDLQNGLRNVPAVPPVIEVIDRAAELAKAFRQHGFPVVLVNATGQAPGRTERRRSAGPAATPPADFADLVDELDAQPGDIRITKQTWGAFQNTSLHDQLQDLGVTQLVVGGVASSLGVESTARSAYEHGYNVVLATDAMTDPDPEAHANAVGRIFPRLGETATTSEILGLIGG
jgi:nicotinamidase-related amidase